MAKFYYINKTDSNCKSTIYNIKDYNTCYTDEYKKPDSKGNIPSPLIGEGSDYIEIGDMVDSSGKFYKVYNGDVLDISVYVTKLRHKELLNMLIDNCYTWDNISKDDQTSVIELMIDEIMNYGNNLLSITGNKIKNRIEYTSIK